MSSVQLEYCELSILNIMSKEHSIFVAFSMCGIMKEVRHA